MSSEDRMLETVRCFLKDRNSLDRWYQDHLFEDCLCTDRLFLIVS